MMKTYSYFYYFVVFSFILLLLFHRQKVEIFEGKQESKRQNSQSDLIRKI